MTLRRAAGCKHRDQPLTPRLRLGLCLVLLTAQGAVPATTAAESRCYGTPANGSLEDGCQLPYEGSNFRAYSRLGSALGRTYVHCRVAEVVLAAYENLAARHPELVFVYGETGWASGGSFRPHKTHQNGLSVDFLVPVTGASGGPAALPTHALNKYGYGLEFDTRGKCGELTIDFEAVGAHLLALRRAADARGVGIARVILAPDLQPLLKRTRAWPALEGWLPLSERPAWVRHDDHYHVDFDVPCRVGR